MRLPLPGLQESRTKSLIPRSIVIFRYTGTPVPLRSNLKTPPLSATPGATSDIVHGRFVACVMQQPQDSATLEMQYVALLSRERERGGASVKCASQPGRKCVSRVLSLPLLRDESVGLLMATGAKCQSVGQVFFR